jgi:TatD DNase family protein
MSRPSRALRPAPMRLIDSHAHLQAGVFAWDLAGVIADAREAGVERILVPGWDAESSAAAVSLAGEWGMDAAVGAHPHDAALVTDEDWAAIVELAQASVVVAIGETGLDYDRLHSPRKAQLANLRRHLRLSLDTGKPAILHCRSAAGKRDAQDALIAELRTAGFGGAAARDAFGDCPPAVLHSFSGPVDYAAAALEMGIAIGFGGLVFRQGEEASAEVARLVPAELLLIETDSPYLAPPGVPRHKPARGATAASRAPAASGAVGAYAAPTEAATPATDITTGFSGRRNSPEWVRITSEWLVKQRGQTPDTIGAGLVAAYDATFRRRSEG